HRFLNESLTKLPAGSKAHDILSDALDNVQTPDTSVLHGDIEEGLRNKTPGFRNKADLLDIANGLGIGKLEMPNEPPRQPEEIRQDILADISRRREERDNAYQASIATHLIGGIRDADDPNITSAIEPLLRRIGAGTPPGSVPPTQQEVEQQLKEHRLGATKSGLPTKGRQYGSIDIRPEHQDLIDRAALPDEQK